MKTVVIETAREMSGFSTAKISGGAIIGFVPTMGALHAGHASLIERAKEECDLVVVSVFVNPTQFNDKTDLDKYPRTFDADRALLEKLGVDVVFHPSVTEIYPNGSDTTYDLDGLDSIMEGPNRPGHFQGMVQVVMRLFDLVQPSKAYFGEKDFQQLAIVKHMTRKLGYRTEIVGCETVREQDGLAMSSRNIRLTPKGRAVAPMIYATLLSVNENLKVHDIEDAKTTAVDKLNELSDLKLEYLELIEPDTLKRATQNSEAIQACIAAWVGDVRLIDNLRVK